MSRCLGLLGRSFELVAARAKQVPYVISARYMSLGPDERHGGQIVAKVLKAHDVQHIFTLVGGHISPLLVASEQLDIKIVDTRHEVTAVFAADAAARLKPGTVGVAAVTAGPGLTNTLTAVKNAQMAESPVLLLGGAAATLLKGQGALQDIDQMSLFKSVCKWQSSVKAVKDIAPTLCKAIQIARSGTPGPVFVELPVDTLYPASTVEKEIGNTGGRKSKNASLLQKATQLYLKRYMKNLFANAFDSSDISPLPIQAVTPSPSQLEKAAKALDTAKAPLILVGSQVALEKPDAVREALETIGIPCFVSGMARGILGDKSDILFRHNRRDALREADVVLLLGGVCDFRLNYGRSFHPKTKIIAVNRDRGNLYKNAYLFWKPEVAMKADPSLTLIKLKEQLGDRFERHEEWRQKLLKREMATEEKNKQKGLQPTASNLNPLRLAQILEEILPKDSILIADGGDFVATASYILRPRGPLRWLDPGPFGTLGVGAGFALGAKMVSPSSQVWILYGDGSVAYSISEFDTFRRFNLNPIALVGNDACWTQISREQVPTFGSNTACELEFSDYHEVAAAFGAKGFLLDRGLSDADCDIRSTLEAAMDHAQLNKPVLINALIGKTDFREGSLSV